MNSILNRCVRRRLFRRESGGFTANDKLIIKESFKSSRGDFVRREERLLSCFREYTQKVLKVTVSASDAESTLLGFLRHHDIEILFARHNVRSVFPENRIRQNRQLRYALSSFIIHIKESAPDVFATLSDIAVGHMITAAILLEEYDWPGDTVRKCNLYLDTPIILKLVGTDGIDQAAVFSEFVSDLRAKGARLWIFEHSRQEAMRILEAARKWVVSPQFDPSQASNTALFFRQSGYGEAQMERFIARLDQILSECEIEVFYQHQYLRKKLYQLDEEDLRRTIDNAYSRTDQSLYDAHPDTILKDVASIAAVHRLRSGRRPMLLREAEHVFVTSNAALARASREILGDGPSRELPACVTDTFVGTILWIDSPQKAKFACRLQILADCYSAVRPDATLEAMILSAARRLHDSGAISQDESILLSTSFVTKDLLSEKTLNDPNAFDSRTTFQILEEIKARIRGEADSDIRKIKKERDKQLEDRRKVELERDRMTANVNNAINNDARRKASLMNVVFASGIISLELMPFVFGLFFLPLGIMALVGASISLVAIGISTYIGKRSALERRYNRLFSKYRGLLNAKFFGG